MPKDQTGKPISVRFVAANDPNPRLTTEWLRLLIEAAKAHRAEKAGEKGLSGPG